MQAKDLLYYGKENKAQMNVLKDQLIKMNQVSFVQLKITNNNFLLRPLNQARKDWCKLRGKKYVVKSYYYYFTTVINEKSFGCSHVQILS